MRIDHSDLQRYVNRWQAPRTVRWLPEPNAPESSRIDEAVAVFLIFLFIIATPFL